MRSGGHSWNWRGATDQIYGGVGGRGHASNLGKGLVKETYDFMAEIRAVFGLSWSVVGHSDAIPEPGDFVTTQLGLEVAIVVRDAHRNVVVVSNSCPHENLPIFQRNCMGRTNQFVCPYHGWTFEHDGTRRRRLFRQEASVASNNSDFLRSAATTIVGGVVFASWACGDLDHSIAPPDVPVLRDEGGLTLQGRPHRRTVQAGWKTVLGSLAGEPNTDVIFPNMVIRGDIGHADQAVVEIVTAIPRRVDRTELVSMQLGRGAERALRSLLASGAVGAIDGGSPPNTSLSERWWKDYAVVMKREHLIGAIPVRGDSRPGGSA